MDIKKIIEDYSPYCEQEKKDKEMILKYFHDFDDLVTRKNEIMHFSSSGFIINKNKDKTLFIFHNIYKSWSWTGGHVDGETDFLNVSLREAQEETAIKDVKPVSPNIVSLDILPVVGHFKNGKYVSSHLHLSVCYLLEGNENDDIKIKEDENSGVKWIPISKVFEYTTEEVMKPVYKKIIEKIDLLKKGD